MTVRHETKKDRKVRAIAFLLSILVFTIFHVAVTSTKPNATIEAKAGPYRIFFEEVSCNESSGVEIEEETVYVASDSTIDVEVKNAIKEVAEEKYKTATISVSDTEYELLCRLVHAESGRENVNEMTSIAATVINRVQDSRFPNDITSVIFEDGQFSPAKNGEIYWYPEAEKKAVLKYSEVGDAVKTAVNRALEGEDPTRVMVTGGTLYFYSDVHISDAERAKRENIEEKIKFHNTVFYNCYSD